MLGNYLKAQISKKTLKITNRIIEHEPYLLPIDKILKQAPVLQKIKMRCSHLKSEVNFIKKSIEIDAEKRKNKLKSSRLAEIERSKKNKSRLRHTSRNSRKRHTSRNSRKTKEVINLTTDRPNQNEAKLEPSKLIFRVTKVNFSNKTKTQQ